MVKNVIKRLFSRSMKDDRLPKIVLFGQPSGATRKAGRPCLLGGCHKVLGFKG